MRVHFLGIGGSGASAAAALAQAQGFEVAGCDLEPNNEFTSTFNNDQLLKGHSASHIKEDTYLLIITPAILSLDPNNPELITAKEKNIPIMTWQQFLGKHLTKDKFIIAVCGTHGKTTTTAMIAQMLEDARLDPTAILGAIVPKWKTNYRVGMGKYFVVEADEFNDNFLHLKPNITVVTNIEMDHPEYFKDFEAVKKSFDKFKKQSKKIIDKPNSKLINFPLKVPGDFNISNASLAYQIGLLLDINPQIIKQSLQNYSGVGRRFEYIEMYKSAKVYSDFGHHPTEIKVTLQAAREKFPKERILVIYQPHMFSRTKAFFEDFVKVFKEAPVDKIFIMDIYPSREVDTSLVTSKQLIKATNKSTVLYIGNASETLEKLKPEIQSGDVLLFMSAGDTDKLARELVNP